MLYILTYFSRPYIERKSVYIFQFVLGFIFHSTTFYNMQKAVAFLWGFIASKESFEFIRIWRKESEN